MRDEREKGRERGRKEDYINREDLYVYIYIPSIGFVSLENANTLHTLINQTVAGHSVHCSYNAPALSNSMRHVVKSLKQIFKVNVSI